MVGRTLNVHAVLVGRVARGDALVIGVELVGRRNGWQLWGEQYNRRLSEIFAVEEDISREISGKLRLHLSGEERNRLSKRYTESPAAYQDYLKGRYHLNRVTEEGLPGHRLLPAGRPKRPALRPGLHRFSRTPTACWDSSAWAPGRRHAQGAGSSQEGSRDRRRTGRGACLAGWDSQELRLGLGGVGARIRSGLSSIPTTPRRTECTRRYLAAVGRPAWAMREMERAHELDPMSLVISMEIA